MGLGLKQAVLDDGTITTGVASDATPDALSPTNKQKAKKAPEGLECIEGVPYFTFEYLIVGGGIDTVYMPVLPTWTEEWDYCASQ